MMVALPIRVNDARIRGTGPRIIGPGAIPATMAKQPKSDDPQAQAEALSIPARLLLFCVAC
jgi:hypothetical protein